MPSIKTQSHTNLNDHSMDSRIEPSTVMLAHPCSVYMKIHMNQGGGAGSYFWMRREKEKRGEQGREGQGRTGEGRAYLPEIVLQFSLVAAKKEQHLLRTLGDSPMRGGSNWVLLFGGL